jgi:hypothetical protein
VAVPAIPVTLNLGFLTILQEGSGYLGGYLVTNNWGRPLEFRLSTAVQPSRIHQILYADTLEPYVCGEVIGKTLVEKTATPVQLLITDSAPALDLRLKVPTPVVWLAPAAEPRIEDRGSKIERGEGQSSNPRSSILNPRSSALVRPATPGRGALLCHLRFPEDVAVVRDLLDRLDATLDLTEPFARIREAVGEARKMGVTNRAA